MPWIRVIPVILAGSLSLAGCKKKTPPAGTASTNESTMTASVAPTMSGRARPAMRQPPRPVPRPRLTPAPPQVKLDAKTKGLVKVVEAALRANKPEAVVALLPVEASFKGCPGLVQGAAKQWGSFEKAVGRTAKQVRDAFSKCHTLGSWAKAKRTATRQPQGEPQAVEGCQRLQEHRPIYLTYTVGAKTAIVKLGAPTRVDAKGWILLDGIRCHLTGDLYR